MQSLSPKSYHCLSWNFDNVRLFEISRSRRSTVGTCKLSHKLTNRKSSLNSENQEYTEDKYRRLDAVSFRFNPRNYSVDCEQSAMAIHRKLLSLIGCDIIQLNDPMYFDDVRSKMLVKYKIEISKAEKDRKRGEMLRVQAENLLLSMDNKNGNNVPSINRMQLKFLPESVNKRSNECSLFTYEDSTCCMSSMSSGTSAHDNAKEYKLQGFEEIKEIGPMYGKAEDYIKGALLTPARNLSLLPHKAGRIVPSTKSENITKDKPEELPRLKSLTRALRSQNEQETTSCGCIKKK